MNSTTSAIKTIAKIITHVHQQGEYQIDGIQIGFDDLGRYQTDINGDTQIHNNPQVLSQYLLANINDYSAAAGLKIDEDVPETGNRQFKTKTMWKVRISAAGRDNTVYLWARNEEELREQCDIIATREAQRSKRYYINNCRMTNTEIENTFIGRLEEEILNYKIEATPMSKDAKHQIHILNDGGPTIVESHAGYNEAHARAVGVRIAIKERVPKPLVIVGTNEGDGTVKWYNNDKGFGFILPDDTREDLFFHYNSIDHDFPYAIEGQRVNFDIVEGKRGLEAAKVRIL
jgi:CspA family cold shock protein